MHDLHVGAAPRALWVRTLGAVWWLRGAVRAACGAHLSDLQAASDAGGTGRERRRDARGQFVRIAHS